MKKVDVLTQTLKWIYQVHLASGKCFKKKEKWLNSENRLTKLYSK